MQIAQSTNRKMLIKRADDAPVTQGRRDFITYRDLGVTEATDGWMRVQITTIKDGDVRPTGWHFHICEGLWFMVRTGWGDIQLEDGTITRLFPGDSGFIPGGYVHNELGTSSDFESMEISIPAE